MNYFKALIVGMCFTLLIGCTAAKDNSPKRVAVLIPGAVEFFAVEKKGMINAAKEHNLELLFMYAQWDSNKQIDQLKQAIKDGVDLIALCSVDSEKLKAGVPIAQDAGIPLMTFTNLIGDNPTGNYPGVLAHVGRNEIFAGKMLVQMLEDSEIGGDNSILLIQGAPNTAPQIQRRKGFDIAMQAHPEWTVIADPKIDGWSKDGTLKVVEEFLAQKREFDTIACQWSACAVAASIALKAHGLKNKTIVALEFSSEIVPYIERGDIKATSYFSIQEEGYKMVEVASKILNGQNHKQFVEVVPTVVNSENVENYKAEM